MAESSFKQQHSFDDTLKTECDIYFHVKQLNAESCMNKKQKFNWIDDLSRQTDAEWHIKQKYQFKWKMLLENALTKHMVRPFFHFMLSECQILTPEHYKKCKIGIMALPLLKHMVLPFFYFVLSEMSVFRSWSSPKTGKPTAVIVLLPLSRSYSATYCVRSPWLAVSWISFQTAEHPFEQQYVFGDALKIDCNDCSPEFNQWKHWIMHQRKIISWLNGQIVSITNQSERAAPAVTYRTFQSLCNLNNNRVA